jgi:hypothetical protein
VEGIFILLVNGFGIFDFDPPAATKFVRAWAHADSQVGLLDTFFFQFVVLRSVAFSSHLPCAHGQPELFCFDLDLFLCFFKKASLLSRSGSEALHPSGDFFLLAATTGGRAHPQGDLKP